MEDTIVPPAPGPDVYTPPPPAPAPGEPESPWLTIWVRPRATMRRILDADPRRRVIALMLAAAVVGALNIATEPSIPALLHVPAGALLAAALVVLPAWAIVGLYLFGFLLAVTGRWLEGTGDAVAVRGALGWSRVPLIWGGLLIVPRFVLFGGLGGDPAALVESPGAALLQGSLGTLEFVLVIWAFVVMLKCLAEAHRFSAWRALGALILSSMIVSALFLAPVVSAVLLLRWFS